MLNGPNKPRRVTFTRGLQTSSKLRVIIGPRGPYNYVNMLGYTVFFLWLGPLGRGAAKEKAIIGPTRAYYLYCKFLLFYFSLQRKVNKSKYWAVGPIFTYKNGQGCPFLYEVVNT